MSAFGTHAYSSPINPGNTNERSRNTLASPQMNVHGLSTSGHTYGNMSYGTNTTSSTSSPFGIGSSLNESMTPSRPQYQPGYLLSLAQSQNPQPIAHGEETHIIPVRAKMNPAFARSTTSDFGTESMFESTKHHRHEDVDEEDGPPASSVTDIVNGVHSESYKLRSQTIFSTPSKPDISRRATSPPAANATHNQPLYVIVFGYPSSRYTATAAHFRSLAEGGTTEPEASSDVENAFKVGYRQPWEAARAWKKNGEIISSEGGRWMVGVKWADPQLAEQILGSGARPFFSFSPVHTPDVHANSGSADMDTSPDPAFSQLTRFNASQHDANSSIGTPLRLQPSATAFKKPSQNGGIKPAASKPQAMSGTESPAKGVLGQVSDLIFGW